MTTNALLLILLDAAPADADDNNNGFVDAFVDGESRPTAVAGSVDVRPVAGSGGAADTAASSNCEWREIIADEQSVGVYDADGQRLTSPTGRWYEYRCDGRQVAVDGSFGVAGAAPVQVDPAVLAAQAREAVEVATPSIETSPEADRLLYVQIPTWLWIPEGWWRSYSATAEAGGVSATVVASPRRAVWSTGDGGTVTCDGPGTAWRRGMSEEASACRHTYRHSSTTQPGDAYELSVVVEFDVTWTSSVGAGGSLPAITRTASRSVQVGEIQAVETE